MDLRRVLEDLAMRVAILLIGAGSLIVVFAITVQMWGPLIGPDLIERLRSFGFAL